MAKPKTIYVCTECGGQSPKWQGQCPACQSWNTLVESVNEVANPGGNRFGLIAEAGKLQRLSEVEAREEARLHSPNQTTPTQQLDQPDKRQQQHFRPA